ncbi:MAG: hypothetical protein Q8P20_01670 [bacterium]|nr:hypothetical protein [bacterium]
MRIRKIILSKIDLLITVLLLLFAVILWYISFKISEPQKSLLINLVAGLIGSIVTIWGIEYFRKKQSEIRWGQTKNIAKKDIITLKNMLVSYISGPLGVTVMKYYKGSESNSVQWASETINKIANDIVKNDISSIINQLEITRWRSLKGNLISIRSSLLEKLYLYAEILPPEIFGQLLKIKNNLEKLSDPFSIFPELFIEDENNWPINKNNIGKYRLLRNSSIKKLSGDLLEYFNEVRIFIELLNKIKF